MKSKSGLEAEMLHISQGNGSIYKKRKKLELLSKALFLQKKLIGKNELCVRSVVGTYAFMQIISVSSLINLFITYYL